MVMVLMAVSVTVWVSGGGAAGGRIGHSAGGALAAVFGEIGEQVVHGGKSRPGQHIAAPALLDRKSTRLNSSHLVISYAVFCFKKKKTTTCLHSYVITAHQD